MAYFTPFIDGAGLHIPTYQDILDDLKAEAKRIYGSDIYLENDSQDYQLLATFALKINDACKLAQLVYNNRGPVTAIGSGLDSLIKLNGITRKTPSYSTCAGVILSGVAGTVVSKGVVMDRSGNKWDLPATVTIGADGTVTVTAVCETLGPITALSGDINSIVTPTAGWTGVTNNVAAVTGQPVETDAQVRSRQAVSVALPGQTRLEATKAGIAGINGVLRSEVYENDTNLENADGVPAHSIAAVVEGGLDDTIAQMIHKRKGPGGGTYGTTAVEITDLFGQDMTINFFRPTYVPIYVEMDIHPLTGYTSTVETAIKQAVAGYLSALKIGQDLTISGIWGAALSVITDPKVPLFSLRSVKAGTSAESLETSDITIAFTSVTDGDIDNITINQV